MQSEYLYQNEAIFQMDCSNAEANIQMYQFERVPINDVDICGQTLKFRVFQTLTLIFVQPFPTGKRTGKLYI